MVELGLTNAQHRSRVILVLLEPVQILPLLLQACCEFAVQKPLHARMLTCEFLLMLFQNGLCCTWVHTVVRLVVRPALTRQQWHRHLTAQLGYDEMPPPYRHNAHAIALVMRR